MEKRKSPVKTVYIVLIVLIFAAYIFFVATRYSGHTMYIPFTGRVFNINSDDVEAIIIQSGNTGRMIEYSDKDEINKVTELLNAYRYSHWCLNPIRGPGFYYAVTIIFNEGKSAGYFFNHSYPGSIIVKGI